MLTLEKLKEMEPHTIFDSGVIKDDETGINMTRSGKMLRWIAKRGHIHDWCIYTHWAENDEDWIADHGDKVNSEASIKMLVSCDDKAFKMYRY